MSKLVSENFHLLKETYFPRLYKYNIYTHKGGGGGGGGLLALSTLVHVAGVLCHIFFACAVYFSILM